MLVNVANINAYGSSWFERIGISLIKSLLVHIASIELQCSLSYSIDGKMYLGINQLVGVVQCLAVAIDSPCNDSVLIF